jgi:hypothetical protein
MTTTALPFGLTGVTYSPNLSEQLLPHLSRSMFGSIRAARCFVPAGDCMATAQAAPAARIVCGAGCGAERAGSTPVQLLKCRCTCAAEDGLAARTRMWRKARLWALHHYFLLESGRNNTNRPLEAMPSGCGSRASRIRAGRQLIL